MKKLILLVVLLGGCDCGTTFDTDCYKICKELEPKGMTTAPSFNHLSAEHKSGSCYRHTNKNTCNCTYYSSPLYKIKAEKND